MNFNKVFDVAGPKANEAQSVDSEAVPVLLLVKEEKKDFWVEREERKAAKREEDRIEKERVKQLEKENAKLKKYFEELKAKEALVGHSQR